MFFLTIVISCISAVLLHISVISVINEFSFFVDCIAEKSRKMLKYVCCISLYLIIVRLFLCLYMYGDTTLKILLIQYHCCVFYHILLWVNYVGRGNIYDKLKTFVSVYTACANDVLFKK